jgi:DNA-binding GntR family transcriptional regulator
LFVVLWGFIGSFAALYLLRYNISEIKGYALPRKGDAMSAQRAYELIRERIISLEMDPGVAVSEIALARQVGLSPAPVGEAVNRLIEEGWLERSSGGVRVTEESLTNIFRQLFEVRSVLERLAGRLAAERVTEEHLKKLEALLPQFEKAALEADNQSWIQLDQRFHEAIYDAAGNVFLENVLEQLFVLDLRIWYLLLNRMTDLPRVVETYRDTVNALRNGDARAAERALTHHIQESEDIVLPQV